MGITPYETELISQIDAINNARPNITPAQHAEWERLVTVHEQYARDIALERAVRPTLRPARAAKRSQKPKAARSTYDPTSVTSTETEIRRILAKGESRSLTEDRYLRTLQSRAAKLNAAMRDADVAAVRAAAEKFQSRRRASATPGNVDPVRATSGELRDGALVAIERAQNRLSSDQQDHLEKLVRESTGCSYCIDFQKADRYAGASVMHTHRATVAASRSPWSQEEGRAVRLWQEEFRSEVRAASEAGSFGLAIPATIDPSIVPSAGELAPILGLCNVKTVTTNVYKGVTSAGSGWAFSSEGSAYADDSPTLAQPVVAINTAKAFIPASHRVEHGLPGLDVRDHQHLESWLCRPDVAEDRGRRWHNRANRIVHRHGRHDDFAVACNRDDSWVTRGCRRTQGVGRIARAVPTLGYLVHARGRAEPNTERRRRRCSG